MDVIDLWLPILLSAVFVFIASSVMHMALNWHKHDYGKLPSESAALEGLRSVGIPPGTYRFPYCESMADMQSDAMKAKYEAGPVGLLVVMPSGSFRMGPALTQWFLFSLVISAVAGYVATIALGPGADYGRVFRVVGTVAILAYATSNVSNSIWKGEPWTVTAKFAVDGLAYGLLTAGTFAWLWPAAA